MPASKAEQVLDALKALLETVPSAMIDRNSVLPEKVPGGGLIIVRDGDPGEPEQALGGFGNAYYQHAVEIEVYVEEGDATVRDAAFDALLQQIGATLEADPTFGGLAFGAVEDANDRALRSSQAWTDGATRFLKDYVAESEDAATATERAFANAFGGAEDSLVGFINTGKLEFQGLADSILADLARMTVRQTITAPLAGALQGAFAGGGLFGLFHEGGIAGEPPPAFRYADAAVFDHAQRYHGGGFAGSGLLPDEIPIIARRGELVVPPERVVREEKTPREQRPITVVVNVTAADASSFRASQGQIAADMARAIDRASRNR
jgi:Lambda phage tail tape-measure protein (Tape_meas_lam_C)